MKQFPLQVKISRKYYKENFIRESVKTEYEHGITLSRPKYTKARKKWTIGFTSLDNYEKQLLVDFFCKNRGYFLWKDFMEIEYIVRFAQPSLNNLTPIGFRNGVTIWDTGAIEIEEK